MGRIRVLVVEDEQSFAEALNVGLGREGFDVELVADGTAAIEAFNRREPDLVLLDLMLPNLSGIEVCREIRNRSDVPIIMVTAKSEEIDTVVGLEVGADDYVTKPYRLRELVARMQAALRRADQTRSLSFGNGTDAGPIVVGDVSVDPTRHEVKVRGEVITMPLKEFELLTLLVENVGQVLARHVLIDRIWGWDYVGDTKTLDVHIKRIRDKVEENPKKPERIVTIRGLGYKYEVPC